MWQFLAGLLVGEAIIKPNVIILTEKEKQEIEDEEERQMFDY